MNTKIILTLLILLESNNCLVGPAGDTDELLAVAVLFRHGDRSPIKSFPTDEFFEIENFPMGLGQLTNKGLTRQYELGQWFRSRYRTFLPERYSPNDILVRSTDVDRTLMSAAANLAGLYPPTVDTLWNSELLWQPIPIHTVPKTEDEVLAMKKTCPRFQRLYEINYNSDFYQKVNKEHAKLYEYVSKYTGLNVTNLEDIKLIQSVFYCYSSYNPSYIPSWAESLNQTELDYLAGLAFGRHTTTDEMKRLRTGPFFNYLLNYFDNITVSATSTPKFLMLSSHDSELSSVLDAMGVYDNFAPSFGATVIWELKRNSGDGTNYINLFYRKDDTQLLSLVVPGCASDCNFDIFKQLLAPVTVDSKTWKEECSEKKMYYIINMVDYLLILNTLSKFLS